MTLLSVNVNKIATLRNARGQNMPNVTAVSKDIIQFGAQGITIHPRPDERHIRKSDAFELKDLISEVRDRGIQVEFNIEGYPSEDFLAMIEEIKPHQCTLVPDPPEVITSNAGWKLHSQKNLLKDVLARLKAHQVRSSVFLDPEDNSDQQWDSLGELKPDRIELYTEAFAKAHNTENFSATMKGYRSLANKALDAGIQLNAGHDLNLSNLGSLITEIPEIKEVSIGHALVCESLYLGIETTIERYLKILRSLS